MAQWIAQQPPKLPGAGSSPVPCITGKRNYKHTRYKEGYPMKTLSIINLKGGVAKTISSVNMAHILAAVHGCKVLLIDNDKQGNASKILNRHSYCLLYTSDAADE